MTKNPNKAFNNIHGRRWGRGARPYLIVAKLVGVAVFLGGLVMLLTMVLLAPLPNDTAGWQQRAELISRAYAYAIVPGLIGAMLAGLCLLASIWRTLIRMRWFVVKVILIVACVPALHLYMRGRSLALQAAVAGQTDRVEAARIHGQLLTGTLITLLFGLIVAILGRIKPRLGQDFGRTFAKRR